MRNDISMTRRELLAAAIAISAISGLPDKSGADSTKPGKGIRRVTPEQTPITGKEEWTGLADPTMALSEFYEAFNNRDLEKMSKSWAQSEEIAMDNPLGGIKRGWDDIKAVYERIFNGPAKVWVEFHDYTIHETGETFYAVGRERGELRMRGSSIQLAIRTTRIFQWIDGKWRQVHHHGSIDDPELLARYQKAVHASV